jgi:hypothetical protein
MTSRDDLGELHALAEAISQDAHGWRRQRRERAVLRAERRREAELLAPGRRRKRHRRVAAAAVMLVAIALVITGLTIRHQSHRHVARLPSIAETVPAYQLADVRAGREAAAAIAAQGRASDVFSCQQWFDSHGFATDPTAVGAGWHEEFMKACLSASSHLGTDG